MVSKNVTKLKQYMTENKGKEPKYIKFKDEKIAFLICKLFEVTNAADCFMVFACANLCNAYVKKPYASTLLKKHKGYGFKKYVGENVAKLLHSKIEGVEVFHSNKFTVVDISGMIFSYHELGVNEARQNVSFKKADGIWKENSIKLQPFAQEIFEEALSLVSDKKISEKNQDIFNKIVLQINSEEEEANQTENVFLPV